MRVYKLQSKKGMRRHKCSNCKKTNGYAFYLGHRLCANCMKTLRYGNDLRCGIKYIPKHR